jgi:hypothetical protein
MKSLDQHFIDWEANTFGFGYGSGENHVLGALKSFMAAIRADGSYDYSDIEKAVTPTVAWLLINTLAHDRKLDYGTSPRFGWLSESGKALAQFVATRSVDDLYDLACNHDQEYIHCYPEHCNCEGGDCRPGNPFWEKRP